MYAGIGKATLLGRVPKNYVWSPHSNPMENNACGTLHPLGQPYILRYEYMHMISMNDSIGAAVARGERFP